MSDSLTLWLAEQIALLKQTPRTGWLHRGIPQPESVASHSYGVIFWTWWLVYRAQQRGLSPLPDLQTALLLALLHDLPEAGTGDLVPRQRRLLFGDDKEARDHAIRHAEDRFWEEAPPPQPPQKSERLGFEHDLSLFLDHARQLWRTLQQTETPEARIVKQADKLDCLLQALFYHQKGYPQAKEFARLIDAAAGDDEELRTQLLHAWDSSDPST